MLIRILTGASRGLLDPSRVPFRVWPHDCDLNFHLNNGRYLAFMDLGRIHLLGQAGLLRDLLRRRWAPVLGAVEINFIRPIAPLARFTLETRLLTWDDKYFYIEQRFESRGRLCALATVKGLFLQGHAPVPNDEVLALVRQRVQRPPAPPLVAQWNALLDIKKRS